MLLLLTRGWLPKPTKPPSTLHACGRSTIHYGMRGAAFIIITCILDQLLLDVLQGQAGLIPEPSSASRITHHSRITVPQQDHAPHQDHCTMQ
jgi:hypothetical protein